jgi:anaerobic magnesium-protoporphyrin IX monomethyl ester cyclase
MAKIHFIYFDINTGSSPGVHHGLASLSATLKKDGHSVSLHHLSSIEPPDRVAAEAEQSNADIIGFSFTTNQRQYVDRYSIAIRDKIKILQIAGGIHATIAPLDVLKIDGIKGACIGEGEYPLRELLRYIDNGQDFANLGGFWWRGSNGNVFRNPVPPLDPEIDKMPSPDYSIFATDRISKASSGWISLMLTRGCPYNCHYCCNHVLRSIYPDGKHYVRIPTPERAVGIVKSGLGYYRSIKGINFADDLLIYRKEWFREFAELYAKKIGLPYTCSGRIESFSDNILDILRRSDCKTVYVGIESGNEWIRKNLLNRHHTNEQIIDCFRRIRKHGISIFAFNIVGFPFETERQMEETLHLNEQARPTSGVVFYFYPYPATRLFEICRQFNLLTSQSSDVSGYLERPAIKLTHCTEKECVKQYNRLRLYLTSLAFVSSLKLPGIFSRIFYLLLRVNSKFWVRSITRSSGFKYAIRKLFYRRRFA